MKECLVNLDKYLVNVEKFWVNSKKFCINLKDMQEFFDKFKGILGKSRTFLQILKKNWGKFGRIFVKYKVLQVNVKEFRISLE